MATAPGIEPDTQADDAVLDSLGYRLGRWLLGGMAGLYALATLLPKDAKPGWWDTWFYGIAILAVSLGGLARPLLVSERTAKRMIASLLHRLGVANRIEAAALAGRCGLLDPQ